MPAAIPDRGGVLRLNRTCVRLCEGQYLDLALESAADATFQQYEQMIARKTAALIECSAALGAWAAGASDEQIEAAGRFGYELGIAFQFQDDLLGVWGDPKVTGKPARDDVRSRKKALPMMLALQLAVGRAARRDPGRASRSQPAGRRGCRPGRHADGADRGARAGCRNGAGALHRVERAVDAALPAGQDGPVGPVLAPAGVTATT